jgi:hypothetical protein
VAQIKFSSEEKAKSIIQNSMAESIFLQNYGMQFSQRGLEQTKRRIPRQ